MHNDEDIPSPYCIMCGAYGEDGCCPPTICKQINGEYCDHYLTILKATYITHMKIYDKLTKELQEEAIEIYTKGLENQ
jgi:predicted metal-binding protein